MLHNYMMSWVFPFKASPVTAEFRLRKLCHYSPPPLGYAYHFERKSVVPLCILKLFDVVCVIPGITGLNISRSVLLNGLRMSARELWKTGSSSPDILHEPYSCMNVAKTQPELPLISTIHDQSLFVSFVTHNENENQTNIFHIKNFF